jgi:hypothetical protein
MERAPSVKASTNARGGSRLDEGPASSRQHHRPTANVAAINLLAACQARSPSAKPSKHGCSYCMTAKELVRVLLENQNPSITHLAVVTTCGVGAQAGTIKDTRSTTRGRIDGSTAYNERGTRLGEYRSGRTYLARGTLFGYGNLLSALVVRDAQRRGLWI